MHTRVIETRSGQVTTIANADWSGPVTILWTEEGVRREVTLPDGLVTALANAVRESDEQE